HHLEMRVLLDLAGTVGMPANSRLFTEHRDWFILNPDNQPYHGWLELLGLDTNLPAVQDYFADFARSYVDRFGIDGYRCDSATASPPKFFARIRAAIQQAKPDAVLIAEGSTPADFETTFDAAYDFQFRALPPQLLKDPTSVTGVVRELEHWRTRFPEGAL